MTVVCNIIEGDVEHHVGTNLKLAQWIRSGITTAYEILRYYYQIVFIALLRLLRMFFKGPFCNPNMIFL